MPNRIRRGLAGALAALFAGSLAAAAEEIAPWMPLEPGRSWTYAYGRDSVRKTGDGPPEHQHFQGTLHDRVAGPAPEFGASAVQVISTLRGRAQGQPAESVETRRAVLESEGLGYQIHALDTEHPILGALRLTRYDPPLAQLRPEPEAASGWRIGIVDVGGLKTELHAEIVGIEDAETPDGRYRDCLVVRYQGKLRGAFEVYGGRVDVTGGTIVVTEWFARGLGVVLAKEDIEQHLTLPDGSKESLSEHIQYTLTAKSEPGGPSPASR